MPRIATTHFGEIDCPAGQIIAFPHGIPAFEHEHSFVLVESPATVPVIYLQSVTTPQLVFITLPPRFVDPQYPAALEPEEWGTAEPVDPASITLLALITITADRRATANLQAPVAIHWPSRQGWQILRIGSAYSAQHPLPVPGGAPCS
jgi:flagellar assembly factor FliW